MKVFRITADVTHEAHIDIYAETIEDAWDVANSLNPEDFELDYAYLLDLSYVKELEDE